MSGLALDIIVIIMIIIYSFMCCFSTEIGAHSPSQRTKHRTNPRACTLARAHAHTHTHTHTHARTLTQTHTHTHTHTHKTHTYNTHTHIQQTHTIGYKNKPKKPRGGWVTKKGLGFPNFVLSSSCFYWCVHSRLSPEWSLGLNDTGNAGCQTVSLNWWNPGPT